MLQQETQPLWLLPHCLFLITFFIGCQFCNLKVSTKYSQRLAIRVVYDQFIRSISPTSIFCFWNWYAYITISMLLKERWAFKIKEKTGLIINSSTVMSLAIAIFIVLNYFFGYQFCNLMVSAKYWQRLAIRVVYDQFIRSISPTSIFCFRNWNAYIALSMP